MFTYCTIRFVDDGTTMDVVIRADNTADETIDDQIFFYGLTREKILDLWNKQEVVEGEWIIIDVGGTYDSFTIFR